MVTFNFIDSHKEQKKKKKKREKKAYFYQLLLSRAFVVNHCLKIACKQRHGALLWLFLW